jgi:dolichyl-phosphate-mannose--protein O-mannosyl transferase
MTFLILVPVALYVGLFYIHLTVLNTSGPHDDLFTSSFQASLKVITPVSCLNFRPLM